MKTIDAIYFALPVILWPLVFLVFKNSFIYAMFVAALLLAVLTVWRQKQLIKWVKKANALSIIGSGLTGAAILYLIFLSGYYLALSTGLVGYVYLVYSMIYSQASKILIFSLLAVIGICEEIYWRAGIQGYVEKHWKGFKKAPWIISTAYYSIVHLSTLNPILAIAAFFVGLVTSILAYRYGIASSTIAHVAWIEFIIIFLPVISIH